MTLRPTLAPGRCLTRDFLVFWHCGAFVGRHTDGKLA